ncbi:MAG: hypothetical protein A4E48_00127 [Methanosaeta sp. PtaU1.Bin060]|nr:MAG: hypothetical protein A4E48_00127 [Methanosaeta sp. PtaU1.Bin060]
MHITPILILDGQDVSRYFVSCHSEQTGNSSKDPGKYDLVLANVGGRFTGAFAPKNVQELNEEEMDLLNTEGPVNFRTAPKKKVSLKIRTTKQGCEGSSSREIQIFSGEIQKAEADELYLKIEGSCTEGGMTSRINPRIYPKEIPISTAVNDLLDDFGYTGARHVLPYNDEFVDVNTELDRAIDFDTAMYYLSCLAQSIYFFDENDEFWFVPATDFRGFSNLTGNVLRGSNATNMVGYCNHVDVFGTLNDGEQVHERKTHNLIHAWAEPDNDWEIQSYGLLKAPPVVLPNADMKKCQEVADKLLEWYRQYKDVPTVKVAGKAPGLLSKVAYRPWNGSIPPIKCDGVEEAEMAPIMGLVTRRIVDISADGGFVSSLDVTTNFLGVNKPEADQDVMNFYSRWQEAINLDPAIVNKYPGVLFV